MRPAGPAFAVALAGGLAAIALLGPGCGGSGDGDAPGVRPAVDRSGQIAALERKRDRIRARLKRERRARERASRSGGDGSLGGLVSGLPGQAGVAVAGPGGPGPVAGGGGLAGGVAWSTIKVPIAERVLEDAGGPGGVDATVKGQITAAITQSDNDAAAALFSRLKSAHGGLAGASEAVGQTLRAAKDNSTVISTRGRDGFSTYGQTEWKLSDQARYMAALAGGCIARKSTRDYLLGEMGSVGGSDTFGLGSAGRPAKWKGGWGPGTDGKYLVRQMGVLDAGGGPVVVAMAAVPSDGTFESGQAMLNRIAAGVVSRYASKAPARQPC